MLISAILRNKGGDIISVTADTPILEVAKTLRKHRIGAVLVQEPDGALDGVLSERDIVRGLADQGPGILERRAGDLMTRDVITCNADDNIPHALALMTNHRFRHLPVLSRGELVGVVSIGDLVKHRIEEKEKEAAALKEYIATG